MNTYKIKLSGADWLPDKERFTDLFHRRLDKAAKAMKSGDRLVLSFVEGPVHVEKSGKDWLIWSGRYFPNKTITNEADHVVMNISIYTSIEKSAHPLGEFQRN